MHVADLISATPSTEEGGVNDFAIYEESGNLRYCVANTPHKNHRMIAMTSGPGPDTILCISLPVRQKSRRRKRCRGNGKGIGSETTSRTIMRLRCRVWNMYFLWNGAASEFEAIRQYLVTTSAKPVI
jgi:hypothetical protein